MTREQGLVEIQTILQSIEVADHAKAARAACVNALRWGGWTCRLAVRVPSRGDHRAGFVDVEATKGGIVAGIEIDNRNPRTKSAIKLQSKPWLKIIATRGIPEVTFTDIDLHIPLKVKK